MYMVIVDVWVWEGMSSYVPFRDVDIYPLQGSGDVSAILYQNYWEKGLQEGAGLRQGF